MFVFKNLKNLGIELGNDQVENWLISFLFSIFIGIFITQPLQVRYLNPFIPFPFKDILLYLN